MSTKQGEDKLPHKQQHKYSLSNIKRHCSTLENLNANGEQHPTQRECENSMLMYGLIKMLKYNNWATK